MKYWLMKSEPSNFSIEDLSKAPKKTTSWDGVRNYQARNFMRDEMEKGDKVIYYHSSCKEVGAVGVATVVKESYPDHTQFDKKSKYYDEKATKDKPRWFMVDIKLEKNFKKRVSREEMSEDKILSKMKLMQKGNRLSILPLSKAEYERLVKYGSDL